MLRRLAFAKKGGRKASSTQAGLVEALGELVVDHTAGSAVDPERVWTSHSTQRLADELLECGFSVSANTVNRLLRDDLGLSRRKMVKTLAMGHNEIRDPQFQRMAQLKKYFLARGWPVLSIDTKKKELLGRFERSGVAWTDTQLPAWDHDFPSSSWGKVIPYGVYDLAQNEAFVYLAKGADTGELACVAINRWWHQGVRCYCWQTAVAATAIACHCSDSNSSDWPRSFHEVYESAICRLTAQNTIRLTTEFSVISQGQLPQRS